MTGELSKNFHEVGIGPLSKILAVKIYHSFAVISMLNYSPLQCTAKTFFLKKIALSFLSIFPISLENADFALS